MKIKSPCLGCEERDIGCHAHCGLYIGYQVKAKEANRQVQEMKQKEQVVMDSIVDTTRKLKRRQKGGGR